MVEDSVHFRLADWNRHSRRETDACRTDYFAIEQGKKFKVNILSDVYERPIAENSLPVYQSEASAVSGRVVLLVTGGLVCLSIALLGAILLYLKPSATKKSVVSPSSSAEKGCPEKPNLCDESSSRETAESSEDEYHCSSDVQSAPSLIQTQPELGDLLNNQSDPVPFGASSSSAILPVEEVKQRAQEMMVALDIAQTCLKEAGHEVEVKDLIPWIAQHQISSLHRADRMQQDARRMLFMASQNDLKREHAAKLAREDPKWLERIRKGCDALVSEVERSCVRVLLVEVCGQATHWYHNMLRSMFQGGAVFESLANQVCSTCTERSRLSSISASILLSHQSSYSACLISCGGRFLVMFGFGYAWIQLRSLLPTFLREAFVTVSFGVACFSGISAGIVPTEWLVILCIMTLGYLGAHWHFVVTKSKLHASFPTTNPSSFAVNHALDSFETLRRCYAVLPVLFAMVHVGMLLSTDASLSHL